MFICYSITYCFSDYVNFYNIFHISLRSSELILYYYIIYYRMFSPMLSCVFIYYTFHIPFSFIYFLYFTCSFPFRVLYFVLSIYCIHVLFISYTVFMLYFSYGFLFYVLTYVVIYFYMIFIYYAFHMLFVCYAFHILYFSYTVILYFTSCSCNCLYFHRIAVLRFSYHVICTIHIISFLGFMFVNTLGADTTNNYVYPKVLSLYETVISVC